MFPSNDSLRLCAGNVRILLAHSVTQDVIQRGFLIGSELFVTHNGDGGHQYGRSAK